MDNNEAVDARETARGLAIRASLLTAGILFIGGWVLALALKIAGRAIHLLVILGAGLIVTGLGVSEVKKVQRQWSDDDISSVV